MKNIPCIIFYVHTFSSIYIYNIYIGRYIYVHVMLPALVAIQFFHFVSEKKQKKKPYFCILFYIFCSIMYTMIVVFFCMLCIALRRWRETTKVMKREKYLTHTHTPTRHIPNSCMSSKHNIQSQCSNVVLPF